jgi:hypothetical protein
MDGTRSTDVSEGNEYPFLREQESFGGIGTNTSPFKVARTIIVGHLVSLEQLHFWKVTSRQNVSKRRVVSIHP